MNTYQTIFYLYRKSSKIDNRLRNFYLRAVFKPDENIFNPFSRKIINLNSIPKSGITWFRFLLANYLKIHFEGKSTPVTFEEMDGHIIHNQRVASTRGEGTYKEPDNLYKYTFYNDCVHDHLNESLELCRGPIIHFYRNPLDNFISKYFYLYKYREKCEHIYTHPFQMIDDNHLDEFADHYLLVRNLAVDMPNILRVSYEMLKKSTEAIFTLIISWLKLPISYSDIKKAIEFSSMDAVRAQEDVILRDMNARYSIIDDTFTGKFLRDGSVGQWKDVFNNEQVISIETRLKKRGISLDEFILE